jgi:hypothetical protein
LGQTDTLTSPRVRLLEQQHGGIALLLWQNHHFP